MPEPQRVPGSGSNRMPDWPAPPAIQPGGWRLPEVSDPRWSTGALVKMDAMQDAVFGLPPNLVRFNDQARFRMVRSEDGTRLAVSVQLKSLVENPPDGSSDYIWFGIAREEATEESMPAAAIRIPIGNSEIGTHIPAGSNAITLSRLPGSSWDVDLDSAVFDRLRVWNDREQNAIVTNGAVWTAQFFVNLDDPMLQAVNANVRVMVHVNADFGTVVVDPGADPTDPSDDVIADLMEMQFALPRPDQCQGTVEQCQPINLGGGALVSPLHTDPRQWHLTYGHPDDECVGLSIDKSQISSGHRMPPTVNDPDPGPRGDCNGRRSNCLSAVNGDFNWFSLEPELPWADEGELEEGDLVARFRISNWGTVGDPTQWIEVPFATAVVNPGGETAVAVLRNECENSGNTVCQMALELDPVGDHQCMLAEIEAGREARDFVTFANASAYVNTRFERASLVDAVATIDLRNMPDVNPTSPEHIVYLNVVKTNMPIAGDTPYQDDIPEMEATRAQVDRSFAQEVGACSRASDYCLPVDGPEGAFCASLCGGEFMDECPSDRTPVIYEEVVCLCVPPDIGEVEQCEFRAFPPDGGYNPMLRAFDGGQVLESTYPTYMVYPYLVTGTETVREDGSARRLLTSLPSFGIHAYHEGEFYGWLTGLTDMNDNPVMRVAEDTYRITVPKDGMRQVHVLLSAETDPHFEPMSQIAGAATTLSFGLGNVFLTAVSDYASPIDLARANLDVNEILSDQGNELVRNFNGPKQLTRLPGATRFSATFTSSSPSVTVSVVDLPLIGQVIQLTALGATVARPSTCGWFGSATLASELRLDDGVNTPVRLRGEDQWTCVPLELINF